MNGRYMMATVALHQLGDISRDEPDLCVIDGEDGDDWIGRWVEGFGFVNVRFPKSSTRELTAEEVARFDGRMLAMWGDPGRPLGPIRITEQTYGTPEAVTSEAVSPTERAEASGV